MKVAYLEEPELEFGCDRHIDIRFGLMNYAPLDYGRLGAPKEIQLGIIGTNQTIEGVLTWLERCQKGVPAKKSPRPNLFPRFPGFGPDIGFYSTLILDSRLQRELHKPNCDILAKCSDPDRVVREAVDLFLTEIEYISQKAKPDVLVCALPENILDAMEQEVPPKADDDSGDDEEEPSGTQQLDFHHLLKARAMRLRVPIQIVLPGTYDETKLRKSKRRPERFRRLQDEATRAWNFHTALYYKAGGAPWRLIRESSELDTCYVGISYYRSLDKTRLDTSTAQVFNERGDGIIVRGAPPVVSKADRKPHLSEEDAYQLLDSALDMYRAEHRHLPARVVLHKTSAYNEDEKRGFTRAARDQRVYSAELISITRSFTRLFRSGAYPPLRGTLLSLDDLTHVLYTRGSVDFFETYPGMYVPRPLLFRCDQTEQTPRFLGTEILALTKMNWNNTQFDGGDPITVEAARRVGDILKYVAAGDKVEPRYSYYM